ncbi:MAG: RNA polymerase sigma factor [Rubripirellula sp.]
MTNSDSNPSSDEVWLSLVFGEHQRPLMGYATHLMGDAERASDVVQDTFVRLCKQPRENVEDRVRQWLFAVCRNRAMDILKKENRMKTLENAGASQASRDGDPQQLIEKHDSARQAESLIGELPPRQQEVIRLKVESDLSYREISELTGLSISNVGFLLHTGLKSIRTRLATIE